MAKCTDFKKKSMLAYGKNMPQNNQFSNFCPEKKYITQKKILPKFLEKNTK